MVGYKRPSSVNESHNIELCESAVENTLISDFYYKDYERAYTPRFQVILTSWLQVGFMYYCINCIIQM